MTQVDGSIESQTHGTPKTSLAPLWLGIVAILAPAFYFRAFLLIPVGAVSGVLAVIASVRARRRGERGAAVNLALALGAIGAVVDIVVVTILASIFFAPGPVPVTIEATGGPTYGAEYEVGGDEYVTEWHDDGLSNFATMGSTASITLTPDADAPVDYPLSCRITWDGVIVSEESADSGPVTCSYDAE